jgi:Ankyrin repeats (3 copies)
MPEPTKQIIKAAKAGDVSTVKALLAADASLVEARDSDGSTPLHCATWKGHQNVVVVLLDAGADVNAVNQNGHWGTTPLHAAAHANLLLQSCYLSVAPTPGRRTWKVRRRCSIQLFTRQSSCKTASAV